MQRPVVDSAGCLNGIGLLAGRAVTRGISKAPEGTAVSVRGFFFWLSHMPIMGKRRFLTGSDVASTASEPVKKDEEVWEWTRYGDSDS